ncbi:YigZ family protein [Corynebacterium sp. TAE3-ERU12]|uniref:YigZ family protein n=1 Tax=Corynebacterium sp. TAE3-ERU12 TaxID=2849491 RepID=UPI001C4627D8|nr:YigZ family protein [Corynebacterium sp. TAE3-ERU12]MBV7296196.1 YigZ family protein [Corynebacterium sp. TAE3-ERU12]
MSEALLVPAAGTLVTGELEIKRSRFITFIGRADDEHSARELIDTAKADFPDARHHCSAYIHQVPGANRVERSSDDGEPSGTAGRPMLDVLAGSGMTNIAAVVVRYFGGVKLGTGGLVRAYSDAVSEALAKVEVHQRRRWELREVSVDIADAGRIEAELRAGGFEVVDTQWHQQVTHRIAVAPGDEEKLEGFLQSQSHGELTTVAAGEVWYESPRR